jgi:hypothetical protein
LNLEGTWEDNYSTHHTISSDVWLSSSEYGESSYHVSTFDNDAMWAVAQNDASNTYNPEAWSVFDWAMDSAGALYYCQSSYDLATEEDAVGATHADATDLTGGCSTFAWTMLRTALDITGSYVDSYGTAHSVSAFSWTSSSEYGDSSYHVSTADNEGMWLIAQNDASNSYNPEAWSVFDWTMDSTGALYYCQSSFDLATEEEALIADHADATDLDGGCSTFAWTPLTP